MPRINRIDVGDVIYHVINRANARMQIFNKDEDYILFEKVIEEAKEKFDMRILSYEMMPNHWHLILYPKKDGDLQKFMGWVSMTHTQRWHSRHKTIGSGHLYQGRYKSFPIETNRYLLQLFRYVERNALRAKLVKKAEDWKWSSLYRREKGNINQKKLLSKWPIDMPNNYIKLVNEAQTNKEIESLRYSVNKGKPYGSDNWTNKMVDKFNLKATLRNPGRPNKGS
ncbi:MAG: transposase [Candidatus Paceibacterota bacterium]